MSPKWTQDFPGRKSSSSERQRILAKQNRYKTYYNRFREWRFPVDPIEREYKIKQLYALVSGSTQSVEPPSRDTPPKADFLAFNERLNSQIDSSPRPDSIARMATEHAASERQRSTIPSQASQILTSEAIDEEQSDFIWYSNRDLGETLRQTRSQFKKLFGKNLPDEIPHLRQISGTTRLKRRRTACEARSRFVDAEPHRASKYPWLENYHKQEISEANLARALTSVVLEYLRPFSAEALDFLWFLRFDLGLSASPVLHAFRPRYLNETVWQAHQADFERRDVALSCGYTLGSQMRTGLPVMLQAYNEMYRLCDIRPDAIRYDWIPDIFKFGIRHPRYRCKAFEQFSQLTEKGRIEAMEVQLRGPLTFPGLTDMPESTFHRQCSAERPQKHAASPKPGRKICTRSCAGCITCKREGENCDGLQSSSEFSPFLSLVLINLDGKARKEWWKNYRPRLPVFLQTRSKSTRNMQPSNATAPRPFTPLHRQSSLFWSIRVLTATG